MWKSEERKKEMTAPITPRPLDEQSLIDLRRRYDETSDAETRTRYQMLLLEAQGQTSTQIETVLRSQDTVVRVLKRFLTGGVEAVPRRAELLRVIELDPHEVGRTQPTGPPSDWPSTCASKQAFRSAKRPSACTYMPMTTEASVPAGR
jgi:hypothetical protein